MTSEQGQRVLDALEAFGPELPIVVLARHAGLRPTQLVPILDELDHEGLVRPGAEPSSVILVGPREGRFTRPTADRSPVRPAPER